MPVSALGVIWRARTQRLRTLSVSGGDAEFEDECNNPVFNGEWAATVHTREVHAAMPGCSNFRSTVLRWMDAGRSRLACGLKRCCNIRKPVAAVRMDEDDDAGADYTLACNGSHAILEHFATVASNNALGWDEDVHISAFSLSYPHGLSYVSCAHRYYSSGTRAVLAIPVGSAHITLSTSSFSYPESQCKVTECPTTALGAERRPGDVHLYLLRGKPSF